ncbi:hypothetical protein MAUB1S_02870 [Mycolicibacterium aubagnense]
MADEEPHRDGADQTSEHHGRHELPDVVLRRGRRGPGPS